MKLSPILLAAGASADCPEILNENGWDNPTPGKLSPSMRYPLGLSSERTQTVKYQIKKYGLHESAYLGFLTFNGYHCGEDFINRALVDGRIKLDIVDTQYVYAFNSTTSYETLKESSLTGRYVDRRTYQFVARPRPDDFSGNKWGVGNNKWVDTLSVTFNGLDKVEWGERSMTNCLQKVKLGFTADEDFAGRAYYDGEDFTPCIFPSDNVVTTTTPQGPTSTTTPQGPTTTTPQGPTTTTTPQGPTTTTTPGEFTHNGDGTGGNAPQYRAYVAVNGEENVAAIGHGPHAADGQLLSNGGYVATGISSATEGGQVGIGWVARVDPCPNPDSYENTLGTMLTGAGSNCATKFKWAWKQASGGKHTHMVSVKESPDGTYVLAAGLRKSTSSEYNGYVVKLDVETGNLIWDFDFTSGSGVRSGFETIHFTSDGGFIVGGFSHREWEEHPYFKSGGQVDNGRPVLHKFSAEIANAASVSDPMPEWTYRCGAVETTCDLNDGSMKNARVYFDDGVEKIVALPVWRTIFIIINAQTGEELIYSGDAINSGFIDDGIANDVEVEFDDSGAVVGFVTTGFRITPVSTDNGIPCAHADDGKCGVFHGFFAKYNKSLDQRLWRTTFNTGDWPGGAGQFKDLEASAYKSLVYTECWGMTKVTGPDGHVGYAAACGSGIEGCDIHGEIPCENDPRTTWRGAVPRIDREGNLVWYRLDSFRGLFDDGETVTDDVSESASEYIFEDKFGRIVSVTDEGMGGVGFLTYECEEGITCF